MKYRNFVLFQEFQTNTWLLWDEPTNKAILVDPADEGQQVVDVISQLGLELTYIIITHGHVDHIGGIEFFKNKYDCPVAISSQDAPMLTDSVLNLSTKLGSPITCPKADILLSDNQVLSIGQTSLKVITTPGHTTGGICLYTNGVLVAGDTLFSQSIGRTDLPGGNTQTLYHSIKNKLFTLPADTMVLPGHGPTTTIAAEQQFNPFVGKYA